MKLSLLKLIGVALILIGNTLQIKAQCTSSVQNPGTTVNVGAASQTLLSPAISQNQYSLINITTAGDYVVNTSFGTHLNITDNSNVTIVSGTNPLDVTFATPGVYRVHVTPFGCASNNFSNRIMAIGPRNRAFNFDGSDDIINIGTNLTNAIGTSSVLTVEAWVKPTSLTGGGAIISNHNLNTSFCLRRINDTYDAFVGFGAHAVTTAANTATLNTWQHVAMVFNSTTLQIFINGNLAGSTTFAPYTLPLNSVGNATCQIGNDGFSEAFAGDIDEVRVWKRAVCQGEIQKNKDGVILTNGDQLLANYHFEQGVPAGNNLSVTNLMDASGNNYTGSVSNAALTGATSNWVASASYPSNGYPIVNIAPSYTAPVVSVSGVNAICNGASTTFTASGASTYTWTSGPTTATNNINPSTTTTYSVVGTSALGCLSNMATKTLTISSVSTSSAVTNVLCNGGTNGSATVTPSGGIAPYFYSWAPSGGTAATANGLAAGVYTVTVTDNIGCTKNQVATITQPTALVTTTAATSILCNGGSTGSATITASGGTGAYSYMWSNGASTQAINGLMAGVYTSTVTDANSCTSIKSVTITQPTALATTTAVTNVLCNGGSTGSATITATGGIGTYTYLWSNGATTQSVNGLFAGVYTSTVTDANNCTSVKSATITQPTAISLSASASNGTICSGNSSTLTANATGGTGAIAYSWVSGPTSSVSVVSPTSTTVYTVDVTDANSCAKAATVSVVANVCSGAEALNFDGTSDQVNLGTSIGNALAGTNKVTIEAWVKPTTTSGPYRIIVGNYSTPANQMQFCIRQQNTGYAFFIGNGSGGSYGAVGAANTVTTGVWQHVSGTWDGSVAKIYINGVLTNTASITYPSFGSTTNSVVIGANSVPELWSGDIDEVRIWNRTLCASEIQNNMNGEIPTTASGLIANYHFNQGVGNANNSAITSLIDDSGNGNNGTLLTFSLTGGSSNWVLPGAVSASVTPFVAPSISVNSGTICVNQSFTLNPTGATTYTIEGGSATVNPLSNSTYTVVGITNGCLSNVVTSSVTVNTLPTITVNSGAICVGQSFTIIPSGANTYTYSNGSDVVTPIAQTDYTVTGTDANGCENMAVSTVTVNILPTLTATTSNTLLCTGETATLTVSGANTYTWSTNETTMDIAVSPTTQTTYTVMGTDANGCENTTTIMQDVSLCTGINETNNANAFSLYPNPNNGLFAIELTTTTKVEIINLVGQIVKATTLEVGKHNIDIQNEASGIYLVKVTTDNYQQFVKIIKK